MILTVLAGRLADLALEHANETLDIGIAHTFADVCDRQRRRLQIHLCFRDADVCEEFVEGFGS